ncbi:hypothetical protein D2E25_0545 [Bifidobacterium goeldii]|uniref:Uncharacterized protein n=1 Tax=Bifidobacterium goeldii TaxID=2306975 RepID=A0A430FN36_9BIFI|nr:hypothetical protein D2E25_0545 [Bifidobacterium goeldii]
MVKSLIFISKVRDFTFSPYSGNCVLHGFLDIFAKICVNISAYSTLLR